MTRREQRLDREGAEVEMGVFFEGLRAGERSRFQFAGPDLRSRFGGKASQVGDMIVVGVRNKNVVNAQAFGADEVKHGLAGRARVEGCGDTRASVPDHIAVNGHVLVDRIERGEAGGKNGLLRIPTLVGERFESGRGQFEREGDAADHGVERLARFHGSQILGGNFGALGQVRVGDVKSALGLVDHVVKIIFERNSGHGLSKARRARPPR